MDRDAVPALLTPGILHRDAQAVWTARERYCDEVEHSVNPRADAVNRGRAVVENDRHTGFGFHPDVHAVGGEYGAISRREDLDAGTAH